MRVRTKCACVLALLTAPDILCLCTHRNTLLVYPTDSIQDPEVMLCDLDAAAPIGVPAWFLWFFSCWAVYMKWWHAKVIWRILAHHIDVQQLRCGGMVGGWGGVGGDRPTAYLQIPWIYRERAHKTITTKPTH